MGLASQNTEIVRSSYIAMELISWYVIVPVCMASLLTGLVQSLGTHWSLFNHYWIVAKLLLTIVATTVLLLHMQPIGYLGGVAIDGPIADGELRGLRIHSWQMQVPRYWFCLSTSLCQFISRGAELPMV